MTEGLDRPESVAVDTAREVLYVSNIRGGGADQDGDGFIARIGLDGTVLDAEWVQGLDAPKGIALHGDLLWVADIDEIVEVNVAEARVVARHRVEGALFLNDVALGPDGSVFVSDTQTHRIHRLRDGRVETWLDVGRLASPNGLLVEGNALLVLADTADTNGDARRLRRVALDTRAIVTPFVKSDVETAVGRLDALQADGHGGYFQSDWRAGRVYHVGPSGSATVLAEVGPGAADLAYVPSTAMLYLPVMQAGQLIAYRVAW